MESEKIILDKENRQIYIQKVLTEYNTGVYQYIHEHRNIHIPFVKEFHEENDRLVVTEEFIQGHTLDELLASGDFSNDDREAVLQGVLDAVEFLHSATPPIIHRDIKPSNIMVTADGVVKLIDYDAAKIKHKEESHDTVYLGTHGSAAPEQYGFGSSDERTDIYAIGILIKYLFPVSKRYQRIAETAAMLDPSDRYQNIKELRRAIKGRWIVPFHINIPGFRSGNLIHMIIALFVYFIMIGVVISFDSEDIRDSHERLFYQITCAGMFFSIIDIWMLWTPVFRVITPIRSKNPFTRFFTKLGLSILATMFWVFVMLVILAIAGY